MTDRQTVALIFGGRSSEHEISCVTAGALLGAIDRGRFDVLPIGITKSGRWLLQPDDASRLALNPAQMPVLLDPPVGELGVIEVLPPEEAGSGLFRLVDVATGTEVGERRVDVAFPLLHGPWGEDGTIQGLFELFGVPFVGSGVLASAVSMDKAYTKVVLGAAGIKTCPSVKVSRREWELQPEVTRQAAARLGLPVFVKPARAGSSVGVSKVKTAGELDAAIAEAFKHDDKALIEQAIVGREIECGVLSARTGLAPRVSVPGEITVTGHEFYDYEAKYLAESGVTISVPADLGQERVAEVQRVAAAAFDALECSGLARVDCFVTEDEVIVNEVNTMPGFTPVSMFPLVWFESGLSYPALVTELIELALAR